MAMDDATTEPGTTRAADTQAGTEKLLDFHVYRRAIYNTPADKRYCVATIYGERVSSWQCMRKPKHQYGGHGWCTQHYPPNEHARKEARNAEYRRKSAEQEALWARATAERKQKDAALAAIKQIAAGHNDPRSLALEVLAMLPTQESHDAG